jgi:hypothetical protein
MIIPCVVSFLGGVAVAGGGEEPASFTSACVTSLNRGDATLAVEQSAGDLFNELSAPHR